MLRFSIRELFAASIVGGIFTLANLNQRDVGSGLYILVQGWPFPAATHHSINGQTVHWLGLSANIVAGAAIILFVIIAMRQFPRLTVRRNPV